MSLVDLLKPAKPHETTAALRSRLASELLEANNKLEEARNAWVECLADEAEGTGGAAATENAEKALLLAKQVADKAAAAVRAVEARQRATEAISEREALAACWAKAERLTEARTKKAATLKKSAEAFAEDWLSLMALTQELNDALPFKPDPDAGLLWGTHVEIAVRQELLRLGVDWAFTCPFGKVSLPEFMPPFEDTQKVIQRWKEGSRG
jgi:hypothetical protein